MILFALAVAACHARGPLPDPTCSPGATRVVSFAEICKRGSAGAARNVTAATKRAVVQSYGLKTPGCGTRCEVDHLISLELGGSNEQANLWPEVYEPRPGAHEKDLAENCLHAELCLGHITLAEAQHQIATDWTVVYRRLTSAQRAKAAKKR